MGTCNRLNSRYNRDNQGQRSVDLLDQEKKHFHPVPPSFDVGEMDQCKVDKYSVISYATNRYSVPDHLVGKMVDVKVYPEKLHCYYENHKICEHERQYSRHGWYINLDHYLYTLQRKPGALGGSQALESAPEDVKQTFEKYFAHAAKDFVELLIFLRDHGYAFDKVTEAIQALNRTCPHDISLDKIQALCMQKNIMYTPRDDHDDQIVQQSWKIIKEKQKQSRTEAISEMKEAVAQGKVLTDLQEIYQASIDGRGALLIVHQDFSQAVLMKDERTFSLINDATIENAIDDITSNIAWEVIAKKGTVYFTSQEEIEELGEIVLKTRY